LATSIRTPHPTAALPLLSDWCKRPSDNIHRAVDDFAVTLTAAHDISHCLIVKIVCQPKSTEGFACSQNSQFSVTFISLALGPRR